MGELIEDLGDMGYVDRRPAPDNRRSKIVILTLRGREHVAAAAAVLAEIEQGYADRLGSDTLDLLRCALERMCL